MAVAPIRSKRPRVELIDDHLRVIDANFRGTIIDLVHEVGAADDPERLSQLLDHTVETGALVLRQGQSRAIIDAIAGEIERLIETAEATGEQLPGALEKPLNDHLARLGSVLEEHFDPKRTTAVQNQLKTVMDGASSDQVRKLLRELTADGGPLAAMSGQLQLVVSGNQNIVSRVEELVGRAEKTAAVKEAREHSALKGVPFQDAVQVEVEAIVVALGDEVRCVANEYGAVRSLKMAGDLLVIINPRQTAGRGLWIAIEAKTGPLNAKEAQEELNNVIRNREAAAAVLVFDSADDAPLAGRRFCAHAGGKFTVVLDAENPDPLALECAVRQARIIALASLAGERATDTATLLGTCEQLAALIDHGRAITDGANAAERGIEKIRGAYTKLRAEALELIEDMRLGLTAA